MGEESMTLLSGGVPELIDPVTTQPSPGIAGEAAMLMGEIKARDGRDDIVTAASRPSALVPTPAVVLSYEVGDTLATEDLTVPSRAPVMTLLGVAPLEPVRPKRVSMPAITNPIAPLGAPRAAEIE